MEDDDHIRYPKRKSDEDDEDELDFDPLGDDPFDSIDRDDDIEDEDEIY